MRVCARFYSRNARRGEGDGEREPPLEHGREHARARTVSTISFHRPHRENSRQGPLEREGYRRVQSDLENVYT